MRDESRVTVARSCSFVTELKPLFSLDMNSPIANGIQATCSLMFRLMLVTNWFHYDDGLIMDELY
jgi:hypothetical protein